MFMSTYHMLQCVSSVTLREIFVLSRLRRAKDCEFFYHHISTKTGSRALYLQDFGAVRSYFLDFRI